MSRSSSTFRVNQRGDVLIESLIGVLLTGILGAGMAQIAARIAESHYQAKIENLTVERLRGHLQSDGLRLCEYGDIALGLPGTDTTTATVTCAQKFQATITISSKTQAIEMPQEVLVQAEIAGGPAVRVGTRQLAEEQE